MFQCSKNKHLLGFFAIPLLFLASPVASQDKSTPGAQCPSGFSLAYSNGKDFSHYEVEGLTKKMYTVADFEEHLQRLQKILESAKAGAAQNGVSISYRNSLRVDDKSGDLHGCKLRKDHGYNSCNDYKYILPDRGRPMDDSITPRIETYLCHQRAGWPTAVDSTPKKPEKAAAKNPGTPEKRSPPPEPSGGYESGDGKTLPNASFVPLDPDKNHEGRPCSYFTKPAVTNDGARLNFYGDGAFVVYGRWMYKCSFGRWESAGLTRLWAKDDVERLRAENLEKTRWEQFDKRLYEEE